MEEQILMPKELTAENGAKGLLIGEFKETLTIDCDECGGDGLNDSEVPEPCEFCEGAGSFNYSVPISWTTIKDIYAMTVKHLGSPKNQS